MIGFKMKMLLFSLYFICFAAVGEKKITIYMIGDSTMANKQPQKYPETGWGMVFHEYFNKDVTINNQAVDGRSTKSFITEHRWQEIYNKLKPGNYVFIEFGHNDEKIDKPDIGASLEEYKANLTKFINDTKAKGAIPVLLTPITRRSYDSNGKLFNSHGNYPAVVRKLAASQNVVLIDMLAKSEKLVNGLGNERSKELYNWADSGKYVNYPNGVKDNTHFSVLGAHKIAQLAVEGIKESNLPIVKYLK